MMAIQSGPAESIEAIDAEATSWVVRVSSGEDPGAEQACAAWRAADPRRDAAFKTAWRAWNGIGDTPIALSEGWRIEAAALRRAPGARLARVARSRTFKFGLPAAIAASVAALFLVPQAANVTPELKVVTAVAETRTLSLQDGSRVTVGARSGVEVDYASDARRVVINSGQAFFEVGHDPARPFIVLAGDAEIRVTGTKFDVTRIGDAVRVSVLEGRVEVRRRSRSSDHPDQVLAAGERSDMEANAGFQPVQQNAIPPGEWRAGRLYYADAPLSEILADAARYTHIRVRAADERVAQMRLTASFRTDDMDSFVGDIESALPVAARTTTDGSVLLERR